MVKLLNNTIAYSRHPQATKAKTTPKKPSQSAQPAFCGLKENLRFGEKLLDNYLADFGNIKSSSKYLADKFKKNEPIYTTDPIYASMTERLKLLRQFTSDIYETFPNHRTYLDTMKRGMKQLQIGNCGEACDVLQFDAVQKGEPAKEVSFIALLQNLNIPNPSRIVSDHTTVMIGSNPGSNVLQRNSWGDEAVSVDPWFKKVAPMNEMMDFYEKEFKLNKMFEYFLPTDTNKSGIKADIARLDKEVKSNGRSFLV